MSTEEAARRHAIAELVKEGFGRVLAPAGFTPNRSRRTWVRSEGDVEQVVALLARRGSFTVQWGLVCPELVEVMWGTPYRPFDVAWAIVTGFPGSLRRLAVESYQAGGDSFHDSTLVADTASVVAKVREDLEFVGAWMRPFRTRADIRAYLLENRDPKDRRGFLVPMNLPLKLFTAAALAVVDRDPAACGLVEEAEEALAPFKGDLTEGRLRRLRAMAVGLCE